MALFRTKKEDTAREMVPTSRKIARNLSWVLVKPHITEKATDVQATRAYVFLVHPEANTRDVATAIARVYKVTPVRVNMVNIPRKVIRNVRTGQVGIKGGGKKAYVYLKEGDNITST